MATKEICIRIVQYLGRAIYTALSVTCLLGGLAASPVWAGLIVTDLTATPKNTETITSVVQVPVDRFTGIYLSDPAGGVFTNEGAISLNEPIRFGSELYGIYNDQDTIGQSTTVVNSGDITLTQSSSSVDAINRTKLAVGISSAYGAIVNSGKVACTVDMGDRSSSTGSAENSLYAIAGVYSHHSIKNYGDVVLDYNGGVVTSSVKDASTFLDEVYGIVGEAGILSKGNLIQINLDAGKAIAPKGHASVNLAGNFGCYGLSAVGGVENYSKIVINTSGGVAQGLTATASDYTVAGIKAAGYVENHAFIDITATAGRAIDGDGVIKDSNVTVYGIQITDDCTLKSTAPISVVAHSVTGAPLGTAKQVFVASGGTIITDYAIKFDGSSTNMNSVYSETIGLMEGAAAKFSSGTLHAYAGKNFQAGTYEIPMLVQDTSSHPADQFVAVEDYLLDFSTKLISGGGTELQKIVFTYEPKVSAPLLAARVVDNVQTKSQNIVAGNLSSLLFADAKTSELAGIEGNSRNMVASSDPSVLPYITKTTDQNNSVFIRPVIVRSSDSSSYGFDADIAGLTFGYTRQLDEGLFLGGHAGYTYSSVDYTGTGADDRSTDIDTYYIGFHALYRYTPNWIFSVISSFYLSDNDYRDDAEIQKENGDYMSYAIRTEVTGGYLFNLGKHNIYPEVGLTHSWQHNEAFTTSSDVTYATTYGTMDDHELYLSGKLKWFREFEIGNDWSLTPLVGVGVTQALLDGELSNSMSAGSSSRLVVDEEGKTTITPEFNLTLTRDDLSFILGYNGGYSDDTQNSMFWFQASLDF